MPLPDIIRDAICGGAGAVLGTYVGMPFDVVKVRLQTAGIETFKSPWHCTIQTKVTVYFNLLSLSTAIFIFN